MKTYVREFYIPDRMMGGLRRYIEKRIKPGNFLTAVLQNDLREACGRADKENIRNLPAYVAYLYNEAPSTCWGSPERVTDWLQPGNSMMKLQPQKLPKCNNCGAMLNMYCANCFNSQAGRPK